MKANLSLLTTTLFSINQKTSTNGSTLPLTSIQPLPSTIKLQSLTHSYPETLLSKLFSSVPKRKLAVDDINLEVHSPFKDDCGNSIGGVTLLVGASAAGKSTILRFLSGEEIPSHGNVFINNSCNNIIDSSTSIKPIILERKPDYDDSRSVIDWMIHAGLEPNNMDNELFKTIANDFCNILGIGQDMKQCKPSLLSPSQQYLFGIACACMKSVASSSIENNCMHYPILLFDELFDKEPSNTVTKLNSSLLNLTIAGGIVVVATHKPNQLVDIARRKITLSSGRVLSDILM